MFNVERDEHAARIARKEIGQRLENIPLDVLEIEEIPEESDETTEDESSSAESEADADDPPSDQSADDRTTCYPSSRN